MKKQDIPKSVVIYGEKWRIKKERLQDGVDGLCIPEKNLILIRDNLKGERLISTYIHEFLHALIYELNFCQTSISGDIEELLVEGSTKGLMKSFKIIPK